jgi:hypothetical protein
MVLTSRDYLAAIHSNQAFNSVFSAILLTKALLFVGYSLSDPDFRLLLDRQLAIFGSNVPERYALMTGVGKVEREVLKRTANVQVIAYDEHAQVLEFLRTLLDQQPTAPAVSTSLPTIPAMPPARAESARAALAHARISTGPSTTLTMRLAGQTLEASVGLGDKILHDSGRRPNWTLLTKLIRAAFVEEAAAHVLGFELAKLLPDVAVTALKEVPAEHMITLQLSADIELLPWEMIEVDGLRNPVVRMPIGISGPARGYPAIRQPTRVLLIGDPNQDDGLGLPGALAEITEILNTYRKHSTLVCDSLIGSCATFDSVAERLSSGHYDIVHFSGHAWFDEDWEPFLMLSNRVKLRGSELRSLISHSPPAVLILNSHFTIFTPPGAWERRSKERGMRLPSHLQVGCVVS